MTFSLCVTAALMISSASFAHQDAKDGEGGGGGLGVLVVAQDEVTKAEIKDVFDVQFNTPSLVALRLRWLY